MIPNRMKAVSALLGAAVALSACGGTSGQPSDVQGDTGPDTKAKEPVELVFFHNAGITEAQFNEMFGDVIRQKLPHVTVRFIPKDKNVTLSQMIASGQGQIDVLIDSIGQVGLGGSLLDLRLERDMTELVQKHRIDLNRFDPTTLDAIKLMGGLYGLPISNSALVNFYNKDIFDKFGVGYPKDGMTWGELSELSGRLTRSDSNVSYVGFSTSINHLLRMNQLSLASVDPKSSSAALEADSWKKLLQETLVQPMSAAIYKDVIAGLQKTWYKIPYADEFAKHQTTAMFMFLYNEHDWMKTMNWEVSAIPSFADQPKIGSQSYPTYMFLTSTSKHPDDVMDVIQLFISDEYQLQMSKRGVVTSLNSEQVKRSFGEETSGKNKNVKNAVFYNAFAPAAPKSKYDTYVEEALRNELSGLLIGTKDMNTALRNAQEAANKKIAADRSK